MLKLYFPHPDFLKHISLLCSKPRDQGDSEIRLSIGKYKPWTLILEIGFLIKFRSFVNHLAYEFLRMALPQKCNYYKEYIKFNTAHPFNISLFQLEVLEYTPKCLQFFLTSLFKLACVWLLAKNSHCEWVAPLIFKPKHHKTSKFHSLYWQYCLCLSDESWNGLLSVFWAWK